MTATGAIVLSRVRSKALRPMQTFSARGMAMVPLVHAAGGMSARRAKLLQGRVAGTARFSKSGRRPPLTITSCGTRYVQRGLHSIGPNE